MTEFDTLQRLAGPSLAPWRMRRALGACEISHSNNATPVRFHISLPSELLVGEERGVLRRAARAGAAPLAGAGALRHDFFER